METKKSKRSNLEPHKSKFFLMGLVFALAFTLSAFEWRTYFDINSMPIVEPEWIENLIESDVEIPITKPLPKQLSTSVDKKKIISDQIKIIDNKKTALGTNDNKFPDIDLDDDGFGGDGDESFVDDVQLPSEIFTKTPQYKPRFNCSDNSDEEIVRYLQKNIKYPKEALQNNIKGKVYIKLLVDKKGVLKRVSAENQVPGGCTEEAIRVVKTMKNWCPGKQGKENVGVEMIIPIKFSH